MRVRNRALFIYQPPGAAQGREDGPDGGIDRGKAAFYASAFIMSDQNKFHLICNACGTVIDGFSAWFRASQRCPACGSGTADVRCQAGPGTLARLIDKRTPAVEGLWHCFDVLPLNDRAKEFALEFSQRHGMPLAAGNFDPMRIEAKKVLLLEWLRLLDEVPTVYMQALSGGTGPLAIAKGWKDLAPLGIMPRMPRFLLLQSDRCSPMADAWEDAKAKDFPTDGKRPTPSARIQKP
jgi:hypothetical protein